MDMIRFGSIDDPGFTAVAGELRRWVKRISVSSTVEQPAPPLVETPTTSGGDETESPANETLSGNAPRANRTPTASPIPETVLSGEQSPRAAGSDVRIGNSEQNLSGTFYGNVHISQ